MLTPVGIGFAGYRSFGSDELAWLSPLSKVNLIAGQNNAGKSNVLRAIHSISAASVGSDDVVTQTPWDDPAWETTTRRRFAVAYTTSQIMESLEAAQPPPRGDLVARLMTALPTLASGGDTVWFEFDGLDARNGQLAESFLANYIGRADGAAQNAISALAQHWIGQWAGNFQGNVNPVLSRIVGHLHAMPPVRTISAFRQMTDDGSESRTGLTGRNVRRLLLEVQNPRSERQDDEEKFFAVQRFVQTVMDDPDLTIKVPYDASTIHIRQHGYQLPIENYGTGIHEVVIIAAAATIVTDSVVCVEEPEIHLHPMLQRKLLRYLATETTNTYVIATHSAHMLDSSLGSVFHVEQHLGRSSISFAGTAAQHSAICADLGYRPSDLVQSNAILWVEGPSDRLYLKWWLEHVAPGQFTEGIHYSIMFYGGSLLKGLSTLDASEVTGFISLRNLNRYTVVMIDSDKTGPNSGLSEPKRRVIAELADEPGTGLAWLTHGYTVENYVPWDVLSSAIVAAHPRATPRVTQPTRYENPLSEPLAGVKSSSKVAIASEVIKNPPTSLPRDLSDRMAEVITLIENANRL